MFFLLAITDFNTSYATSEISSFIYQLQDVKRKKLLDTDFDIGVIDIDDANSIVVINNTPPVLFNALVQTSKGVSSINKEYSLTHPY